MLPKRRNQHRPPQTSLSTRIPWIPSLATAVWLLYSFDCYRPHITTTNNNNNNHDYMFIDTVMAAQHSSKQRRLDFRHSVNVLMRGGGGSSSPENDTVHNSVSHSSSIPSVGVDNETVDTLLNIEKIETDVSLTNNTTSSDTTLTLRGNDENTGDDSTTSSDSTNRDDTTTKGDHSDSDNDDTVPIQAGSGNENVAVLNPPTKKSNAVGDSDGDDDDDDDDDNDDDDDEEDVDVDEIVFNSNGDDDELTVSSITAVEDKNVDDNDDDATVRNPFAIEKDDDDDGDVVVERVQVEVEYDDDVKEAQIDGDADSNTNDATKRTNKRSRNLGGIGVRSFGRRFKNRNNKPSNNHHNNGNDIDRDGSSKLLEQQLLAAWQPYVFFPPPPPTTSKDSAFWQYLQQHQSSMETDSKLRLDRRTLYGGLLAEFTTTTMVYSTSKTGKSTNNRRKFLATETSQALQAAISLATQPTWRKSLERPSAIRLYEIRDNTENNAMRENAAITLAMQETISLGLAHSFGTGMVILDDSILSSIRQQLLLNGCPEQETKAAALIKHLLALARKGTLQQRNMTTGALISNCMQNDLTTGMDDPFDERAMASYDGMKNWENRTVGDVVATNGSSVALESVPLVIFLRTQHSSAILRSKSAIDTIISECNSSDSRNFLVLGNGIDATTVTLPQEDKTSHRSSQQQSQQGSSPWFGFTPHSQKASGENDPEGSRRFNIFLARTTDQNGTPGLLGAIAPPEAGNLFPHMMAMQARQKLEQTNDEDSPMRAELERWSEMLQQQIQANDGNPLATPQFFNATISNNASDTDESRDVKLPSPELIQKALENAMGELLDGLAKMSENGTSTPTGQSPELQKAFAQVLRNENLRRGIAENLARAAPALSDPKCQGVLLSVFVPPPPDVFQTNNNSGSAEASKPFSGTMGGWFQKMLSHQEEADRNKDQTDENRKNARERRVRTMAAAAAVVAAQNVRGDDSKQMNKAERNLSKLEAICRPIIVNTPSDPVRAKSWDAWVRRERGAVIFRQNRRMLKHQLEKRFLLLQEHTGTKGAGSSLRQMLSVRLLGNEIDDVVQRAIELEAAKSQQGRDSYNRTTTHEQNLDVDITLSQLLVTDNSLIATEDVINASAKKNGTFGVQFIHPSSLESALSSVCRISPSPGGALSQTTGTVSHRSKDEIAAMAQDKHERALISQVVSPQDIGVTYDMIGGLTEVKELLRQSITYPLKFPHLYSEGIAREAVKGVLLFGPPGTGKTMLAKAVATEGGASFLSVDASSVENKWLGESEKNAKAVFTLARRLAPCVIFIDEVDSLLSSREGSSDDSAHGTLTSVKTTMMSEWDGLNSGTNGSGEAGSDRVIVIGSTNRPFDLDEAVLRRFPRRILVDLPDLETRTEILEVTLAENRLDPGVNLTVYAERLDGYTGSDIKEFCREAVVQISHEQAKLLDEGFHNEKADVADGSLQRLRPVTSGDFDKALKKLKRSVSENGRELARVWEWNDEYGEMKRNKKNSLPPLANMYL